MTQKALARDTGSPGAFLFAVLAFGLAACFGGQARRGVRLLTATDMMLRKSGIKFNSAEGDPLVMGYKQALEKAQAQLGPAAFEAAGAEGQQMTMEQAVALATENKSEDAQDPKA